MLTKVDVSGPVRANAWMKYLTKKHPEVSVVQVESYTERAAGAGQGKRRHYDPHIPTEFRKTLVDTLKAAHASLCEPPPRIRENQEALKKWEPNVKVNVDWKGALVPGSVYLGKQIGGALAPKPTADESGQAESNEQEPDMLTIGLIGMFE